MIFEVLRDKTVLMSTEHESCIPSAEQIKSMKSAGLAVKLDGKSYPQKRGRK